MNLRLSVEQSEALRRTASQAGISMQEAALQAIDEFISKRNDRLAFNIAKIKSEDAQLLKRLSQ